MSARISFNHPTGQPTHINNNSLEGQIQQPSRFYQTNQVPVYNDPASLRAGSGTFPGQYPSSRREPVVIDRERVQVKQIERPQFEKVYNAGYPNKKLGPEEDPVEKKGCCNPCCWAIAALLGLAAITLALLFGLGVIGGSNHNNDSNSVAPIILSGTKTNTTTDSSASKNSTTTTTTTTETTNSNTTPSGVTGVSNNGGSNLNTGGPGSIPPSTGSTTTTVNTSGSTATTTTTSGSTSTTTNTSGSTSTATNTSGSTSTATGTSAQGVVPASVSPIPA